MMSTLRSRLFVTILPLGVIAANTAKAETPPPPLAIELTAAIRRADAGAIRELLSEKAEQLEARDGQGWTPLMHAALFADARCLRVLVDSGADVNAKNQRNATALHYAATDLEKVRYLLKKGAQVNVASKFGNTPLILAARTKDSAPIVRLLLNHKADVTARNRFAVDALMVAASSSNTKTVRILLKHGADAKASPSPNALLSGGQTALTWSARMGDVESAKLLLEHGAEVNSFTSMGPPLIAATQAGHRDIVRLLLSRGADVDGTSEKDEWTALMWAAADEYADPALASLLLEHGASPNVKRGRSWGPFMSVAQSPLMIAKRRGETALVEVLRKAGARSGVDPRDAKIPNSKRVPGIAPDARLDTPALIETVSAALPLLEHTATASQKEFVAQGFKCISCHNQLIPSVALSLAKSKGFPRDEESSRALLDLLKGAVSRAQHASEPTMTLSAGVFSGYLLWGLGLENTKPSFGVDANVHALASFQEPGGNWSNIGPRVPIQGSRISSTALALKGLDAYPLPGRRSEFEKRTALSREWLRKVEVRITEDHAFRLLGLHWADVSPKELESSTRELLSLQRPNGGWAQLPKLESDAYATGLALYALREAGRIDVEDTAFRKGLRFLVTTQLEDGSWFVRRRAYPFQPTMDPVFPHGRDGWISVAATSWAVMALSAALDRDEVERILADKSASAERRVTRVEPPLPSPADRVVDFADDVEPILDASCTGCHKGSEQKAAGGYSMDSLESLMRGNKQGPPVVLPGSSSKSLLILHVANQVEDVEMPPPARRKSYPALTEAEIGVLRAWIDQIPSTD